jgi:hypothetical protein
MLKFSGVAAPGTPGTNGIVPSVSYLADFGVGLEIGGVPQTAILTRPTDYPIMFPGRTATNMAVHLITPVAFTPGEAVEVDFLGGPSGAVLYITATFDALSPGPILLVSNQPGVGFLDPANLDMYNLRVRSNLTVPVEISASVGLVP